MDEFTLLDAQGRPIRKKEAPEGESIKFAGRIWYAEPPREYTTDVDVTVVCGSCEKPALENGDEGYVLEVHAVKPGVVHTALTFCGDKCFRETFTL